MTPYVRRFVSNKEAVLFENISKTILALPDVDLGLDEDGRPITLSCHMLARATAKVFCLKYADGYFYPNFEHSWVLTPEGHVIDVYPIGMLGGPILVDGKNQVASRLYETRSAKGLWARHCHFGSNSFRRSVNRTVSVLKRIKYSRESNIILLG